MFVAATVVSVGLFASSGEAGGRGFADVCGPVGVTNAAIQAVFGSSAQVLLEVRTAPGPASESSSASTDYCHIEISPKLEILVNLYPASQASMLYAGYDASGASKQALSGLGAGAISLQSGKPAPTDFVLFTAGDDFVVINGLGGADPVNSNALLTFARAVYATLTSATPTLTTPATVTVPSSTTSLPGAATTTTTAATSTTAGVTVAPGHCPSPLVLSNLDSYCTKQPATLPPGHWKIIARRVEAGAKVGTLGGRVDNPVVFAIKISATRSVTSQVNYSVSCYANGGEQLGRLQTVALQTTPILVIVPTTETPYCNIALTASKSVPTAMTLTLYAQEQTP